MASEDPRTSTRLWGTGTAPREPWPKVRAELSRIWKPGNHFSIIAPTDYGKSYFALRGILPLRSNVVVLDPKGGDSTLEKYGGRKVKGFPSWWERRRDEDRHYRIAPGLNGARPIFDGAIREVWRDDSEIRPPHGDGWTIYLDETRIISDKLRMRDHLETLWIAGRSRGITLVASTQAPRFVPTEFYDQARFIAFGNIRDRKALLRFGEIGGDVDLIREIVPRLEWHEFLIVGPRFAVRTKYRPQPKIRRR